jgi:hypothetical protein
MISDFHEQILFFNKLTSPGTTSVAFMTFQFPSRLTVAVGLRLDFRAVIALPALFSS